MKDNIKVGDVVTYTIRVSRSDFAIIDGKVIHKVYSTYALARDFESTTRQFVVQCKEEDEEGVGTMVLVEHKAPAFEDDEITFKGYIAELNGNEVICSVTAHMGTKLIAVGRTGQKVIKKTKLESLFKGNG